MSDLPATSHDVPRWNFNSIALLVLILALGATLRYMRASADGLTFDEMWHVELATGRGSAHGELPRDVLVPSVPSVTTLEGAKPWPTIWTHMTGVVHPPLYVLALRPWISLFGTEDTAAKLLSSVCQLIAIVLLFDALRIWNRSIAVAFWAALLFSVAPAQVYTGQLVRSYAMLQLFACAMLCAIVRIERFGETRGRIGALGTCAFAVALTHYLGIALDLAIGAYVLLNWRGRARRDAFLAMCAAGAIYLIAWGPFMWRQHGVVAATADSFLVEHTPRHALQVFKRALAIPIWQVLPSPNFELNWPSLLGGAVLLSAIVFMRRRPDLRLWIFWLAGSLVFVATLDAMRSTRMLAFQRYTALAAPALFAMIASLFVHVRIGAARYAIVAIATLAALVTSKDVYKMRIGEPEWHLLGNMMREHISDPREPTIFYAGASDPWMHDVFFLSATYTAPELFPRPVVSLTKPADESLISTLGSTFPTVVLISGKLDRPADQVLPGSSVIDQTVVRDHFIYTRLQLPSQ